MSLVVFFVLNITNIHVISFCYCYYSAADPLGASVNGAWPPHTNCVLGNYAMGREAGDTVRLVVVFYVKHY